MWVKVYSFYLKADIAPVKPLYEVGRTYTFATGGIFSYDANMLLAVLQQKYGYDI